MFSFKKRKINAPNREVFGVPGTGKVSSIYWPEHLQPITAPVTGSMLLDALRIRGHRADGAEHEFTWDEIYMALERCRKLLYKKHPSLVFNRSIDITLSARQSACATSAIDLCMSDQYNLALHELWDMIDDYGEGLEREITVNEFVLYECVIRCFEVRIRETQEKPKNTYVPENSTTINP